VVHAAPPGILPTQLTYDPQGRIAALDRETVNRRLATTPRQGTFSR
jgi:hypothetical protein